MAGYVKKIAVIKQLKGGFSADGGAVSGLVKAETYAGYLKVEVSLINFAPLSEGRYVFGISDGNCVVVFEDVTFECESPLNCQNGFAFVVCFCKGTASPVASAYCGQAASWLPALTQELQKREQVNGKKGSGAAYDDEAISEVNYYEDNADKDGEPVCQGQKEEELLPSGGQNAEVVRPVKIDKGRPLGVSESAAESDGVRAVAARLDGESVSESAEELGGEGVSGERINRSGGEEVGRQEDEEIAGGLAGGDFYSRMQGEIEKIFSIYPKASDLEEVLEGSRFVKIEYGNGQYYAFGVLYIGGNAAYVCYGVPSLNDDEPPKSLKGFSSYIPCKNGGYWMTYQDARTGVSVGVELT
ncbi:MAG: hypothetical protein ACI4VK_04390 [Candidatus Coproplasma sp.]